jgi:ferritin
MEVKKFEALQKEVKELESFVQKDEWKMNQILEQMEKEYVVTGVVPAKEEVANYDDIIRTLQQQESVIVNEIEKIMEVANDK